MDYHSCNKFNGECCYANGRIMIRLKRVEVGGLWSLFSGREIIYALM